MKRPLCILSLFFFTLPCFAGINAKNGFYLGANLATAEFSSPSGTAFGSSLFNATLLIRPVLGYRLNDFFAVEAGYNGIEDDSQCEWKYGP